MHVYTQTELIENKQELFRNSVSPWDFLQLFKWFFKCEFVLSCMNSIDTTKHPHQYTLFKCKYRTVYF